MTHANRTAAGEGAFAVEHETGEPPARRIHVQRETGLAPPADRSAVHPGKARPAIGRLPQPLARQDHEQIARGRVADDAGRLVGPILLLPFGRQLMDDRIGDVHPSARRRPLGAGCRDGRSQCDQQPKQGSVHAVLRLQTYVPVATAFTFGLKWCDIAGRGHAAQPPAGEWRIRVQSEAISPALGESPRRSGTRLCHNRRTRNEDADAQP